MKYIFLGGAGEVGASCLLIKVAGRNILIDCGVRVNRTGMASLPDLQRLKQLAPTLDAIFISHAHIDHVGALPLVHEMYPNAPIYMTDATYILSDVMLIDASRLQYKTEEGSLYTNVMVVRTWQALRRRVSVSEMNTWIPFLDGWKFDYQEGWDFMFIASGHILGAVSIVLRTPEGTYLYSGDVSAFNQRTVDGIGIKPTPINPDFMWCEATYGESNHPSRSAEEQKLAKAVAVVINRGGCVLIPSFALGRAQEIIMILKTAMQSGTIPAFQIYTDGLVNVICDTYKQVVDFGSESMRNLENNQGEIFFTRYVKRVEYGERDNIITDTRFSQMRYCVEWHANRRCICRIRKGLGRESKERHLSFRIPRRGISRQTFTGTSAR